MPLPLEKYLTLLAQAVLTLARRARILPGDSCAAEVRVKALTEAFAKGIDMLAKHVTKYFGKMQFSANRRRMATFVKLDLEAYGRAVHDRGYWLLSRYSQAPPVSEFGPPVVPVWKKLISYVKAGGLINAETSTGRAASATGVARPAGAASSGTCRRWERSGECQYGQACTFVASHVGTRSKTRRTSSGGDKSARDGRKGGGTKEGDGKPAKR